MAKSGAGVRMGNLVGYLDGTDASSVCHVPRHRRARARHPFQPGMGAGEHGLCLGRACANHPDLDARLRRNGTAGGDCGHAQRHPPVSDGGVGIANGARARDKTAAADTGDPFHRGYVVGRMLSTDAAGAARAPNRLHAWARLWAALGLPRRHRARLRARRQPSAAVWRGDSAVDAARVPALHRAQLPPALRRAGTGTGIGVVSARLHAAYRGRYPGQRRVCRHHRLRRSLVAGAAMSEFVGDWHSLLVLLLAGFLPNEAWRMMGLWLGGGVDEGSELLVWVRAVATAILAGVIAQILIFPPGALASVPDWLRFGAVAAGFAVFMV